jgi:hypothetical protein
LQGSNIFDGFSKKMIKEDHYLACTTRMFEIFGAPLHKLGQTLACKDDDLDRPNNPVQNGLSGTHPRGIRYSLVKEQPKDRISCQTPASCFRNRRRNSPKKRSDQRSAVPKGEGGS